LEQGISTLWKQRRIRAKEPENWQICFKPLWLPSAKEQAETSELRARACAHETKSLTELVKEQVLTPDEARRYLAKHYPEFQIEL